MGNEATARPTARWLAEEISVMRWRRAQFARLGFTPLEARRLAAAGVDLDYARRLIARGCSQPLALAILL